MKISINFDCDNAAFDDEPATGIARILRGAADRVEQGELDPFILRDINGNPVGEVKIT